MTPQHLANLLRGMTHERALEMALAARSVAQPAAAKRVAAVCEELVRGEMA
jgi:UDP-N-acetylglucosamine:LPS N-acetylglucosamine transferase